jgi:hypothetical protein
MWIKSKNIWQLSPQGKLLVTVGDGSRGARKSKRPEESSDEAGAAKSY